MILLEARALRFQYPGGFRLEIDEFRLHPHERVAVVGPNGSGKTTLLRLLAFLERPTSWQRFRYRGRDVAPGQTSRGDIGLVRQQPWIFQGSVADNLAYSLKVRRRPRREILARVDAMCRRLELKALENEPARRLSGGEQKRLALGRVLIATPEILLLDEPTAHLDRRSKEIVKGVLSECESAVLFTTHDTRFGVELAERTLTLNEGRFASAPFDAPYCIALGVSEGSISGRVVSIQALGDQVVLEVEAGRVLRAVVSRADYMSLGLDLDREVRITLSP